MAEDARPARPPPPKPNWTRTLMFMMFFLTLFVLIDPNLRDGLAAGADTILYPLIGFGGAYPVITILLAGSLTTIISAVVRHFFTDWVAMARTNKRMSALRKAQMDALRRGNTGKVQKLREIQVGMQKETMDVQFQPMKSLAFTFLVFIIVFAWLGIFVSIDTNDNGRTFFAVPWSSQASLLSTYVFPAWLLLYSLLAIPMSQVAMRLLKFVTFQKRLAALEARGELG